MGYKPILHKSGSSSADNAVVFQLGGDGAIPEFDTFQIGSTAGVMDVFGSGDGVNYLADPLALIDLTSTTPSTLVQQTTAGKHFGLRGKFRALRVLQNGATAVQNAYIIAHEST